MRLILATFIGLGILATSAAVPLATPAAAPQGVYATAFAQDPPVEIRVDINDGGGAWWLSPIWMAIGVIAVVLLVVIVAMAARGGGTTVIKE